MLSRLIYDNTDAFYRMSMLYYHMGEAEDALRYLYMYMIVNVHVHVHVLVCIVFPYREIRECLKLDPDHKVCFPFYKARHASMFSCTVHCTACTCAYIYTCF